MVEIPNYIKNNIVPDVARLAQSDLILGYRPEFAYITPYKFILWCLNMLIRMAKAIVEIQQKQMEFELRLKTLEPNKGE